MNKWQPVGAEHYPANSRGLACPTHDNRAIDTIGENLPLSNPETPKTKENAASTGMDHGVQNAVQNTPLHNTTPCIILQGRWIILEERPDGCHIVMIEDDVFYLLRVLPYGGRGIARVHAQAFAKHYGAQCGQWSQ